LSVVVAADAIAAALPPVAQWMSGQRWVHCLVFGWLVCCEPPPFTATRNRVTNQLCVCVSLTKLVLGPEIFASQTHITYK
jgi:hypothetical protein